MKRTALAVWLVSMTAIIAQAGETGAGGLPFTIRGVVSRQGTPIKVILTIKENIGPDKVDSAEVRNGHFTFKGIIPEPVRAFLSFIRPGDKGHFTGDLLDLFLDKGVMTVTTADSIRKATVSGSPAQAACEELNRELQGLYQQLSALGQQSAGLRMRKDTAGRNALSARTNELWAAIRNIKVAYVRDHPAAPIDIWVLESFGAYYLDVTVVGPLYDRLDPSVKATPSGKELGDRLETFRKTAVGRQAMDFSQPDTSGKMVSLASFRGKYVLVDFWASWCHVCRQENPYVLKAYNTYKDKGFTVLTVSLDTDKAKWEEAFNKDGMLWITVSDLKGADNAVALAYGVSGIPKSLLIDPSGKIIAKNLRGDDLCKELEEVLK